MLKTKLYRPSITSEHVRRDEIIECLDENLYKPLTLVSAGAGYGKSMLISSWLEKSNLSYAWISLDKADDDFKNFLDYVNAGIKMTFPDEMKNLDSILSLTELPTTYIIAESLINDLDEITQEFVIVLDDYHFIRNQQIHELLNTLIKYPPQHVHLVIITRRDPMLSLNKLRATGRLNEIRMGDLSFNKDEIAQLFKKLLDIDLSVETISALHEKTEGWVTGLRLSSLSIKDPESADKILNNLSGNMHVISTYLIEEVLSQVSDKFRENLLKTAHMDRFCADLIDNINEGSESAKDSKNSGKNFIDWLIRSSLFIIPLDDQNVWFRYHHLFQELLQKQTATNFDKDSLLKFHLLASSWFEDNEYLEEAIDHAIKSENLQLAVNVILNNRFELLKSGQVHRLNKMIDLLPEWIIEETPALLTSKSFIMEFRAHLKECNEFKEKAKKRIDNSSDSSVETSAIQGEITAIEGELSLFTGNLEKTIELSQKALELLPIDSDYAVSFAIGARMVGYQMLNDINSMDEIVDAKILKTQFGISRTHGWCSIAYAMQGDTSRLKKHAKLLTKLGKKNKFYDSVVYGNYFLGVVNYLKCDDTNASPYLKSVIDDPYIARPHYYANCAFMLASVYIKKGDMKKATELIENVIQYLDSVQDTMVANVARAMRVELTLKTGDIGKAIVLDTQQESYDYYPPIWFIYVSQLTPIKLKLAINTKESVKEAIQLLSEVEVHLRKTNKVTILIDLLILQTLALKAQGKRKDALLKLEEALSLSSAGNCIRSFVDYGSSLNELLIELLKNLKYKYHIGKIIDEINRLQSSEKKVENNQNSSIVTSNTNSQIENLSFREAEILKMVADGLRNKEIAEKLFLSEGTIKKHMSNIAHKLGTTNRVGSVLKAEELGII